MSRPPLDLDSDALRKEGNIKFTASKEYQKSTPDDVSKRLQYLKEATSLYEKAITAAGASHDSKASAAKNCVQSCFDITNTIRFRYSISPVDTKTNLFDDYYNEMIQFYDMALKHCIEALDAGQQVKNKKWNDHLKQSASTLITSILLFMEKIKFDTSIPGLPSCLHNLVLCQINLGSLMLETDQYDKGYAMLSECSRPMAVLEKTSCTTYDTLSRQLADTLSRAEAWKMFHRGKNMFSKMIDDDELNVEYMDDAIDSFHAAINRMNGKDLKLEAMAYSYLGQLYYKTVHNVKKSAEYLQNCNELVDLLELINPNILFWYKACVETMRLIRDQERPTGRYRRLDSLTTRELREEQADNNNKIEEELMVRLTPRMARSKYDDLEFIHYIYHHYPPRNTRKPIVMPDNETLTQLKRGPLRKLVASLTFSYHPDKIRDDPDGIWKNTCTEICEGLNGILEKVSRGV